MTNKKGQGYIYASQYPLTSIEKNAGQTEGGVSYHFNLRKQSPEEPSRSGSFGGKLGGIADLSDYLERAAGLHDEIMPPINLTEIVNAVDPQTWLDKNYCRPLNVQELALLNPAARTMLRYVES